MRVLRTALTVQLTGTALLLYTPPAQADAVTWFESFDVEAELDEEGLMHVTTRIDYDFQELPSRGVHLTFVTRQEIEGDRMHERVYEFADFRATSSTGAATEVNVEEEGEAIGVYVGDPERMDLTGVHSYEISYTVAGIPNAGAGEGGEDEVYWNIVGSGFGEPIKDFRMRLTTPAEPVDAACWEGAPGSRNECAQASTTGRGAEFHATDVAPGEGVTIAAQYPAGSFEEDWAIIERGDGLLARFTPATIGVGAGALAALAGGAALFSRHRRKDEVYVGLTPGLSPAQGQEARTELALPAKEYAVQFHPPREQIPAEIGTLVTGVAKPEFLAATLVDLAVRGHLVIETDADGEWTLHRTEEGDSGLTEHEQNVLRALFPEGSESATLDGLSSGIKRDLRVEIEELPHRLQRRGWFSRPVGTRLPARGMGRHILLAVSAIILILQWDELGLRLPLFLLTFLLLAAANPRRRPRRLAPGSAVYAQAMGFRKYLETAEADQLEMQAGEDLFSRYLPYAMVFGLVDRWVDLFQNLPPELSSQVRPMTWLRGPHQYQDLPDQLRRMDLPRTLRNARSTANLAAQSVATGGSSGGSGFSGGGGSSGGGVSGGGGGRW